MNTHDNAFNPDQGDETDYYRRFAQDIQRVLGDNHSQELKPDEFMQVFNDNENNSPPKKEIRLDDYVILNGGFYITRNKKGFNKALLRFKKTKNFGDNNVDIDGAANLSFPCLISFEVCYRGYSFIQVRHLTAESLISAAKEISKS